MTPSFEWNKTKAAANRRKHGVTFEEAATVFADPLARIFDDPDHSGDEKREIIIGHSTQLRLLVVGFRERKGKIRLINARGTTKRERKTMRKTSRSRRATTDLRPEYQFDYRQGRPNRLASRMRGEVVAVVLEPDVAQVFDTSASVNRALRSVISGMPTRARPSTARKPRRNVQPGR